MGIEYRTNVSELSELYRDLPKSSMSLWVRRKVSFNLIRSIFFVTCNYRACSRVVKLFFQKQIGIPQANGTGEHRRNRGTTNNTKKYYQCRKTIY